VARGLVNAAVGNGGNGAGAPASCAQSPIGNELHAAKSWRFGLKHFECRIG
jgi:hypothetical protein